MSINSIVLICFFKITLLTLTYITGQAPDLAGQRAEELSPELKEITHYNRKTG
jgi:hypothetical protein